MVKNRYKNWTREELLHHLLIQASDSGISTKLVTKAVNDERWNPMEDFNGCNVIQDDLHPFLPCFIHDWRWIVYGRINKYDKEFRANLLLSGFTTFRATIFYIAVRLGSIFYSKYTKNK